MVKYFPIIYLQNSPEIFSYFTKGRITLHFFLIRVEQTAKLREKKSELGSILSQTLAWVREHYRQEKT